jgi:hypothetical protein
MIQNPLAVKLLNGDISAGQTVNITVENGELAFTPVETATKTASPESA